MPYASRIKSQPTDLMIDILFLCNDSINSAVNPVFVNFQVINSESKTLSQSRSGRMNGSLTSDKALIKVNIADIVSVSPCADLTLPPGAGLSINTIHSPVFLVIIRFKIFNMINILIYEFLSSISRMLTISPFILVFLISPFHFVLVSFLSINILLG